MMPVCDRFILHVDMAKVYQSLDDTDADDRLGME